MAFEGQEIFVAPGIPETDCKKETLTLEEAKGKFKQFIREWSSGNSFVYRDQLTATTRKGEYTLNVDLEDLAAFNDHIGECIRTKPTIYIPLFEQALKEAYESIVMDQGREDAVPDFQVQFSTSEKPKMLRDIQSSFVNQLIVVPGIVTIASRPYFKAKELVCKCMKCGNVKRMKISPGLDGLMFPRLCDSGKKEGCPLDPYVIIPEECSVVNVQSLRIQENPEQIPTGEIPRSYQVSCERYLVDKVQAGNRVRIVGVLSVRSFRDVHRSLSGRDSASGTTYIRAIGVQREQSTGGKLERVLSAEDEGNILKLAKDPGIRKKIIGSIASAIYGSDDIKEAIACLMFGGSPKMLPDKTRLRGDINVLLLGDPSTAKSQFLKFVERAAPIGIYTSGKGSSAAGLTATITKNPGSGEFQLEGGAMVLADGGVVCIDEFDKMNVQDRVAIHEAMEQQTISVAKAGITTVLNSRAAVLAAANPVFGHYNDLKQAAEQIDFQSTILSRFDCIFLVKDVREDSVDRKIAEHVLRLHMGIARPEEMQGELPLDVLKKYITYARAKCFPRLTEESGATLENYYVEDRVKSASHSYKNGKGIPITVRQLEAIIRLSESLAKMQLSTIVTDEHVKEAHRVFTVSTMSAASSGFSSKAKTPMELKQVVIQVEDLFRKRVAIQGKISTAAFTDEINPQIGVPMAIDYALHNMMVRGEIEVKGGGRVIFRKK